MKILRSIVIAAALLALAQSAVASQSLFPSRQLGPLNRLGPSNRHFQPAILPKLKLPARQKSAARPEVRSYQPYAGLQYRFRPEPPAERSVRSEEPEITTPKRVEPLVQDGEMSLGYAYCPEPRRNVGLPGAPFSGPPAPSRTCP